MWILKVGVFFIPETKYVPVPFGKWDEVKVGIRWPPIFAIDIEIADRLFIVSRGLRWIEVIPERKE